MLYPMWVRALAIAAVALVLAPFVYPVSSVGGGVLIAVAGMSSVWALVVGLRPRFRSHDPYSLAELRRVVEEEEIDALHEGMAGEGVVCPRCFTEYPARLGACPRCGGSG